MSTKKSTVTADITSDNWNHSFTALLRNSKPTFWGNWALSPTIKPGMIGYLDSNTGAFVTLNEVVPGAEIVDDISGQQWNIKSGDVTVSQSNVSLDGSYTDPETGLKITAGLKVDWGFSKAGSLNSSFAVSKESTLKDFPALLKSQFDWLKTKASELGMTNNQGISQGFCVITDVIYAKSGLNIGANTDNSNFSVTGSASGVNELVGASVNGSGSYAYTSGTSSMETHVWPSEGSKLSTGEVPIAFSVASFDGILLIPNWTHAISAFVLILDNSHGGTYKVNGSLAYDLNGETKIKTVTGITGGLSGTIGDIPLGATNLVFTITFLGMMSNQTFVLKWDNPISQWLTGVRHVDCTGVWPGKAGVTDREG